MRKEKREMKREMDGPVRSISTGLTVQSLFIGCSLLFRLVLCNSVATVVAQVSVRQPSKYSCTNLGRPKKLRSASRVVRKNQDPTLPFVLFFSSQRILHIVGCQTRFSFLQKERPRKTKTKQYKQTIMSRRSIGHLSPRSVSYYVGRFNFHAR